MLFEVEHFNIIFLTNLIVALVWASRNAFHNVLLNSEMHNFELFIQTCYLF
jgi:hypothetical protein